MFKTLKLSLTDQHKKLGIKTPTEFWYAIALQNAISAQKKNKKKHQPQPKPSNGLKIKILRILSK